MNKKMSLFLLLAIAVFSPLAAAREAVEVGTLSGNLSGQNLAANALSFTVTSKSELIAKPGSVFTEGGNYENIALPYLISHSEKISYPRWAIRQGWQGKLSIAIEVLTNGSVGRTKIMKSTGYRLLDQTAEKAIKTWKFHPATKDGKAIVECIQIAVAFQLTEE